MAKVVSMNIRFIYRVAQCSLNSKIVFASAFFYCLAFIALESLFLCIIPALFLLSFVFYKNLSVHCAWYLGLWWGILVYGFHCGLIFYSLYLIKPHFIIIFLWFLATLYLSISMMALFIVVAYLQQKIFLWRRCPFWLPIIARCALIFFSVSTYFWWIDNYAFFIFGVEGGCCLVSPIIPLGQLINLSEEHIPLSLCIIRPQYKPCQEVDPDVFVYAFFNQIADERNKNKSIRCIITPESALPFALNKHPKLLKILCDYSYGISLLVGSFLRHNSTMYNCFYFFSHGILQEIYIKQHALPLTEMIPWWCDISCLRALFLKNNGGRESVVFEKNSLRISCHIKTDDDENIFFYPILCSEFFCTHSFRNIPESVTALVLVNDAWFANHALRDAALKYARFQAWWYKKKMLYVSYFICDYF